jgi:Holliday junction resolvase RusA-like endonuclease
MIRFVVPGLPVAQGSKRHVGNGIMVETAREKLMPWRDAIIYAARARSAELRFPTGPINACLHFYFPRPKSHYRTGRNSHLLKDSATEYKSTKPDLDKLVRAALDAITQSGRIWRDDAQVAGLTASKRYGDEGFMDVRIREAA